MVLSAGYWPEPYIFISPASDWSWLMGKYDPLCLACRASRTPPPAPALADPMRKDRIWNTRCSAGHSNPRASKGRSTDWPPRGGGWSVLFRPSASMIQGEARLVTDRVVPVFGVGVWFAFSRRVAVLPGV